MLTFYLNFQESHVYHDKQQNHNHKRINGYDDYDYHLTLKSLSGGLII